MKKAVIRLSVCLLILSSCQKNESQSVNVMTAEDVTELQSAKDLSSSILPASDDYAAIPQDPKNPLTADKVALGKYLFYETRLGSSSASVEGLHTYSCATCHHAEAGFQSGLAQAIGEGGSGFGIRGETRIPSPLYQAGLIDVAPLRTPTVMNTAYQEVMMWSGQFGGTGINIGTQSSWTAGTPKANNFLGYQGLETTGLAAETKHRLIPDTVWLAAEPTYKNLFDLAFPDLPENERITSLTVSFALAAYQRTILPNQAPFQKWLKGDTRAMTKDEKDGKTLFFGKAKCSTCHSGPALSSMNFYSLGMADLKNGLNGAFNIPDNPVEFKGRGGFTNKNSDMYKFKVPQLYNLKDAKFMGHGASFSSVTDIIKYINNGISQNQNVPASQLARQFKPLLLTDDEINKLVKFVEDALYDPNLIRYVPDYLPSGSCMPNNDSQSRIDRGCQ